MGKNDFYKQLMVREFYYSPTISCLDLSMRIEKSLPLTLKILNELIADGIVTESGYAPSSGGRRPLLYSVKNDTVFILSVAMDQLFTRISLMNMENKHVTEIRKIELTLQDSPSAIVELIQHLETMIKHSGVDKKKIAGIGIGMPGFIDISKGINYSFPLFLDGEKNIATHISEKVGLPVFIDNDSSLIALAELRFGAARNKKNAMVINIGWGVGLGMILNGELFRGNNGFAGEFSHIPLFTNNKICSCGKSGCLETESSLLVLVEKAKEGLASGRISTLSRNFPDADIEKDFESIIQAALKGDKFSVEMLSQIGYNIGRGIAILIHLNNPESVILSGRGSLGGRLWQSPVQQAMNEHCIPRLAENTTVEISKLGYQAELIGSAALVMDNLVKKTDK